MGKKKIINIGEVSDEETQKPVHQSLNESGSPKDDAEKPEEILKAKKIEEKIKEKKKSLEDKKEEPKKKIKKDTPTIRQTKKAKKKKQRSAKYKKSLELVEREKLYDVTNAIKLAKNTSYSKFPGSLEIHIKLGIKVEKTDQHIRGLVQMPHKVGKTPRILAFTKNKNEALKAGAKYAGLEDLITKVQKGFSDFDIVVAQSALMSKIAKLGKTLGTKGKMPSIKAGTIDEELPKLIKSIVAGRIEYRNDSYGIVHQNLGKLDMENKKLIDNLCAFYGAVVKAKPKGVKKDYIRGVTFCATIGPGIKIDISDLNELLKTDKRKN